MSTPNITELIDKLHLSPHPEGGYFAETYRSELEFPPSALPEFFGGKRNASTAIFFLLPNGAKSHLHRIKSDEIWHFHLGGPMCLVELYPDGTRKDIVLGPDIIGGQKLQHAVPAGCWFGGYPLEESEYSLVGCTVCPGFDFHDFELGERKKMLSAFPDQADIVEKLTV